jgi:RimJ/RimL family protein N-acetyltransferase
LGIFSKDSDRHIGNTKLGFINSVHGRGQLSLVIGEKALWGRGLAKEIVRAMTRYGFDAVGLSKIEAGVYESNLSSLKAFRHVGYNIDGFFRSHAVVDSGLRVGCFWLSILRHEFDLPK